MKSWILLKGTPVTRRMSHFCSSISMFYNRIEGLVLVLSLTRPGVDWIKSQKHKAMLKFIEPRQRHFQDQVIFGHLHIGPESDSEKQNWRIVYSKSWQYYVAKISQLAIFTVAVEIERINVPGPFGILVFLPYVYGVHVGSSVSTHKVPKYPPVVHHGFSEKDVTEMSQEFRINC